jgi:hypothetical protein
MHVPEARQQEPALSLDEGIAGRRSEGGDLSRLFDPPAFDQDRLVREALARPRIEKGDIPNGYSSFRPFRQRSSQVGEEFLFVLLLNGVQLIDPALEAPPDEGIPA